MPDEVARIGALSNGSNGQRSSESASLHFERYLSGVSEAQPSGSPHTKSRAPVLREGICFEPICTRERSEAEPEP